MAEIKIAGIMRAGVFSPNRIGSDAAIFNIVAEQLRKRGCEVNLYSEEEFIARGVKERVILNMCRQQKSVEKLQQLEDEGALVINSGYGIENCCRERMTRILLGSGIPYPESLIVNSDEGVRNAMLRTNMTRCWIKGAKHTLHKEDVSYVRSADEAQEVLQEYFLRGIDRAVITRHIEGELVKFYGVADTPFFYWFLPFEKRDSRPGFPAEPERPQGSATVDKAKLMHICRSAAEVLDVKIFGGDCIVAPDGTLTLIDFDDWPSFAPCRNEAAPYIAKCVMSAVKSHFGKTRNTDATQQ